MLIDLGYQMLDYVYSGNPTETSPLLWNEFKRNPLELLRKIPGRLKKGLLDAPVKLFLAVNEDVTVRTLGTSRLLILVK